MASASPALNPAQQAVVAQGLLEGGLSAVLQLPTGSGKTWLAERAISAVLARGGRSVVLTPLRALARELVERWRGLFAPAPVGVFTGDFGRRSRGRKTFPVPYERARVLVMTPERLELCTRAWRRHWRWLTEVELLVVDEVHLLGEPVRGPRLEGALMRARRLNPFLRLLALSATMGNGAQLADWLEGVFFESDHRAVPLRLRLRRFRKASDKPALLEGEVRRCLASGGQSLVFVQSRRRAEALARRLVEAGLAAAHHHAGLDAGARREVEAAFRGGELRALLCTSTLEMGLNLPARQVVLYDLQRFDGADFVPLSTNAVWQRAGRAGRPGLDDEGEAVLLAPSWDRGAERYLEGRFEPIESRLGEPRAFAEQVLAEVGSGLCPRRVQLERALGTSLAARQGRLPRVEGAVQEMLAAGMLQEAEDTAKLRATPLGRIALRQLLSPATVLALARAAEAPERDRYTFLDLLLLAAGTADASPRLSVDFEELPALASALDGERATLLLGDALAVASKLGASSGRGALCRIKAALVARSWTRLGDASAVASRFGLYPFEVHQLAESLERILLAFTALPSLVEAGADDDDPGLSERAGSLVQMVRGGLDEGAVTLTFLDGLGVTLARRLTLAGLADLEALALAEVDQVAAIRGVSATRAARWIDQAGELVKRRGAARLVERGPTVTVATGLVEARLDPYRLRRARELTVRALRSDLFEVSGGLEPHRVEGAAGPCDCPDHRAGQTCKHLLAVRLFLGDRPLLALAERLEGRGEALGLELSELWMGGSDGLR